MQSLRLRIAFFIISNTFRKSVCMFKKLGLICCLCCFLNCKQQPKNTVETSQKHDSIPKVVQSPAVIPIDETDFEPFDASEYFTTQVLIGKSETFIKQKIKNLHIVGENSYKINPQGLITALYNISNNYSEYTYTKSGLLKTKKIKQHTPALTYYQETFYYKKDGTVQKSVVSKYDQHTKESTQKTIVDTVSLKKSIVNFKGRGSREPFKINHEKRIILSYGSDLVFCCGELMPWKNSLQYYYNKNQLIDSVVINGLESGKKMVFKYEYNSF